MDPRDTIDDLRRTLTRMHDPERLGGEMEEANKLGATLVELAMGAAVIGELPSNSDTIRYVFGTIEEAQGIKGNHKRPEPGPYFVDLFQLMVLAAKPDQRNDIFEAVGKATGLAGPILK